MTEYQIGHIDKPSYYLRQADGLLQIAADRLNKATSSPHIERADAYTNLARTYIHMAQAIAELNSDIIEIPVPDEDNHA